LSAFGAACPFRLVLANVPSPNPQQPFAAGDNLLGQAVRFDSDFLPVEKKTPQVF
jgi:hypothetical protein